jgi:hypothetical protein
MFKFPLNKFEEILLISPITLLSSNYYLIENFKLVK